MQITKVERDTGKRYRVFVDGEYRFPLYEAELKRYQITEQAEVEEALIQTILNTVILKRAKERAFYLLERKPYTVSMLKDKLLNNGYPAGIVEQTVCFLLEYHYLDDDEYIQMYVQSYQSRKSKKQICYDLMRKGIDRELAERYLEQMDDVECFKKQFNKYVSGKDLSDAAVRQKIFRHFYAKGFPSSMIQEALREF